MKTQHILFVLVLLMSIACTSPKKEVKQATNPHQDLADKLDEYFNALTKIKKFNGGILIQKQGDIVIYKAYNMQADVKHSLYANKESQFDIHSISKLMAKACLVKMEGAGLINRKDKLNKFIPGFPKGELISIQHLLDNQSGLPRRLSKKYDDLITKGPAEVVELIKKEDLLFAPGSETVYSNLGYQLIYYIISEIAKKPFVEYVNDELFVPLGMNHSGAHYFLDKGNLKNPVKNHTDDDGTITTVPNILPSEKNQAKIYSTLEDLLKFLNHVKEEPYLSSLKRSSNVIGWSGGGEGIFSHASASLNSGYEFTLFSNYDGIPFGDILKDVEKIMTNKPYELPKEINRQAVTLDKEILERYVGKYDMPDFNSAEFEFRIEDDKPVFYQDGERNTVLNAENDSTFFDVPDTQDVFVFRKDGKGRYMMIYRMKGVDIKGKLK